MLMLLLLLLLLLLLHLDTLFLTAHSLTSIHSERLIECR